MKHLLAAASLLLAGCATSPEPATKPAIPERRGALPDAAPVHGPTNPKPGPVNGVTYYGSIVGLDPAKEKLYRELHADVWPDVRRAIRKANIRNFNIYVTEIDRRLYLVSTFEYVGKDPAKDFATIAKDPVTRDKWWPLTDGCQIRLPGTPAGEQWRAMEQVMHIP